MTADKRNTTVVIALVFSLTVGARILLWLEPGKPHWSGETLLMAERGTPVEEVAIAFAESRDALETIEVDARDSLCVVYPDEEPQWWPAGPRVTVVVVGSGRQGLSTWQKGKLLATLGSLNQASGQELVRVRLAPELDARANPELPPEAKDLRDLLARKRIIE